MRGTLQGGVQASRSRSAMEWAPAEWLEQPQEHVENIKNELELKDPPQALCHVEEQPYSQKRARIEGPVKDHRALTLLLKMGMNSQHRLRKVESCMEYSLQMPTQQPCVQAVLNVMKEYNTNALSVGAPQVHAWAALLQAVCKIENAKEDAAVFKELQAHFVAVAQDRDFAAAYLTRCQMKEDKDLSILKIQVVLEARTLVTKVTEQVFGFEVRCVSASQDRVFAERCSAFAWYENVILGMHMLLDVIKTVTHALAHV